MSNVESKTVVVSAMKHNRERIRFNKNIYFIIYSNAGNMFLTLSGVS
jgi:hypothetical protein